MILEVHNQDEKDWFPDSWLRPEEANPMQPETMEQSMPNEQPTVVSPEKIGSNTGIVGKMANLFGRASK